MIDLAVKNVYLRTINLGFLERIRIGIVFDLFVYIFHGARNWVKTCRTAFLTSDSREMAFKNISKAGDSTEYVCYCSYAFQDFVTVL